MSIGYDLMPSSISIQSISTSSNRVLSSASSLTISYTVSASSHRFVSSEIGIASCMSALNDSVNTLAFDSYMHSYASSLNVTSLLSVSTIQVIMNTAAPTSNPTLLPTSSPTSYPTSRPTTVDIILVNLLAVTVTAEVVKTKVQYYIGAYIAYFAACYICLYVFAFTKYGRERVKSLYDSSYESEVHRTHVTSMKSISQSREIDDALTHYFEYNIQVQSILQQEALQPVDSADISSKVSVSRKMSLNSQLSGILAKDRSMYSKAYRTYLNQRRCLLGCKPILYPTGFQFKVPYIVDIVLPPGRFEDWILYVCNNHPWFLRFYYIDGHPLGKIGSIAIMYES